MRTQSLPPTATHFLQPPTRAHLLIVSLLMGQASQHMNLWELYLFISLHYICMYSCVYVRMYVYMLICICVHVYECM